MGGPAPQAVLTRLGRAGAYRTARTPYREIMDALSPRHPTQHAKNIETGMPKNEVATPL